MIDMPIMKKVNTLKPPDIREIIRKGEWDKPTTGVALGYAQANLVILPEKHAFDFFFSVREIQNRALFLKSLNPANTSQASLLPDPM
jgi:uncharacterized protein YcsI (UPF0317 family)